MTKIKKKLTFFRRGDLPKQSGPPRRNLSAASGAWRGVPGRSRIERRGSPQTHIHTRAYQRLAVVGPPQLPQTTTTNFNAYGSCRPPPF